LSPAIARSQAPIRRPLRETAPVPLSRLAWLITVGACLLTAVLLLLSGYDGYAAVATAIGLSAAINLR
jgi:hypothetical protein